MQRQISALLEEGKALAYKQSEMEKAVRKARGELKGVEQERNSVRPTSAIREGYRSAVTRSSKLKVVHPDTADYIFWSPAWFSLLLLYLSLWWLQLQQDKEALELRVGSLAELVKRKEQENSSLTQSLAAVQAVNQASSDKLAKVGPLIEYEYQIKS